MRFLKSRSEEISSLTSIIGLIVGVVGFGLTLWQLHQTELTLKAQNTYQIQQDSRALVDDLMTNVDFVKFTSGSDQYDENLVRAALWKSYNFYLAVYRQSKAGGITSDFTDAFKQDFCNFLRKDQISASWDQMARLGQIGTAHLQMRSEWCAK